MGFTDPITVQTDRIKTLVIIHFYDLHGLPRPVFFNLGSVKPKDFSSSSLGSERILKFTIGVFRFRQMLNDVSKGSKTWKKN